MLDIQIRTSFDSILEWRQDEGLGMGPRKNHSYWFWSFCHSWNIEYKFGPFRPNFDFMMSQGLPNFQILERWRKTKFFALKYIHGSNFRNFYCCLVAIYCFETTSKNLKKWRQKTVSVSYSFPPNILQKFLNYSVKL